jgi:hypothetical protein
VLFRSRARQSDVAAIADLWTEDAR